jgi:hypothetical protein
MTHHSPFDHPAAWAATEHQGAKSFEVVLSNRHRDALLEATEASRDVDPESLAPDSFPLPSLSDDLAAWTTEVRDGRGLVLLRNMPIETLGVDDACRLFFGLGSYFGVAVSQSNLGEKIGHVVNIGGQDPRERAYRNARPLNLHTDRCDYVGMLCLRPALHGGVSGYASALTIHNIILATRPHLMAALYEGFYLHRFGEQTGTSMLTKSPIPIFSQTDGIPNVVYIRGYIDLAVDEGLYALSDVQAEALEYFDEVANRPEVRMDLTMAPGDAAFTNNCVLLHNRTAFEDDLDPAKSRHLLRLWLMDPDMPSAPGIREHKGMQGIEKMAGRGTYYEGPGYRRRGGGS